MNKKQHSRFILKIKFNTIFNCKLTLKKLNLYDHMEFKNHIKMSHTKRRN